MNASLAVLVAAALVGAASAAPKSLPSSWPKCKTNDPDLGVCLQTATNAAVTDLAVRGAKSLGVPPIDPLHITQLNIDQGSGPVSIGLNFSNLEISGFKDAKVERIQADLKKWTFKAPVTLAATNLVGDYTIKGKVLILPIVGSGKCEIKMERLNATIEWVAKEEVRDGLTYLNLEKFLFVFNAGFMKMHFENLFNGNKQLADQMNIFLNTNWQQILAELQPAIQDAFGIAFRDISNRIFAKVPLNKIFAD